MADTPDDPSESTDASEAAEQAAEDDGDPGHDESAADRPAGEDEAAETSPSTDAETVAESTADEADPAAEDDGDTEPADSLGDEPAFSESAEGLSEVSADESASEPDDPDDEPTGGLRRVDDSPDTPRNTATEDEEDVGLPGPSMDTKPDGEPATTADLDDTGEHVADAPYGGEIEADDEPARVPEPDSNTGLAGDEEGPEPIGAEDGPIMGGGPESEAFAPDEHPPDPEPIRPDETPAPAGEAPMAGNAATAGDTSFMDAPPDDEEMPLTEHIEEMVLRLSAIAVVAAGVASIFFIFAGVDAFIQRLWYHIHPGTPNPCVQTPTTPFKQCAAPHVYGPLEYLLTKVKLSGLVGLIIALPVGVYQTYLFMRPGLYPKERRYYLASVPMSLVLALVGVAFATFIILPLLFEYFLTYSADTVSIAFQLEHTINLMLVMMAWLAVIFQIPLLMMLGVLMGVTSRQWMASRRIYFWGGFGGVAFLFSAFDPTGVAPILLTITMIVLFEVTLLLLRWVGR